MKYRSYNSEILIATTLLCDTFNDIIIDRRKHGLNRDFSKPITLRDIVQQKIEVPCILGDRGIILKSLENEAGTYKLPLIILQQKDIKTDQTRFCDIHADIFYQQDSAFSELDETDKNYRPQELSKRRGQPITISYDATFITKYKEDLDQIISNFAVHFKPDIYLKWWHPKNKVEPLTSQLTWSHNISYDAAVDYNPQNLHVYKATTSFTFKTWLFFGMEALDNRIDPNLETVITKIKFFPNSNENRMIDETDYDETDYEEALAFRRPN